MSLFGAMNTAISGLDAQAASFSNISDNMANSQTIGYKGVDTAFIDYLTTSTATQNQSGSVASRPLYQNEVQGSIQQSTNPLALAISGQGFFAVSEQNGEATNSTLPTFSAQQYYSRAGDFVRDANGYLVNSAGGYLNGWPVNQTTGAVDTSKLVPIQVAQTQFKPVPTSQVSFQANVPATPGATSTLTSETLVYDPAGSAHALETTWTQTSPNNWTLNFASPDNIAGGGTSIGSVNVAFNPDGTPASLTPLAAGGGALSVTGSATDAAVQISPDFGNGAQPITIDLGSFNLPNGVTQFAGTNYNLTSVTQNGTPPGSFTGISTTSAGDVVANYDNGRNIVIANVPLITFENANALQRQDGEAFTATQQSGAAQVQHLNQNGAGGLVVGSIESSNVDLAAQLSKLIVAQQAYGANAKVITTANELLTATLNIKQ